MLSLFLVIRSWRQHHIYCVNHCVPSIRPMLATQVYPGTLHHLTYLSDNLQTFLFTVYYLRLLGKMPLIKKAHEKISRPRAGFNDRHEPPDWPGKDGAGREWVWARHDFYRRGRIRGWRMRRGPWQEWSLGGPCLGAWEILLKGGAVIGSGSIFQEVRPEDKMAADL
jgi:hypothetical protein